MANFSAVKAASGHNQPLPLVHVGRNDHIGDARPICHSATGAWESIASGTWLTAYFVVLWDQGISVWPDVVLTPAEAEKPYTFPELPDPLLRQPLFPWLFVSRPETCELKRDRHAGNDSAICPKLLNRS